MPQYSASPGTARKGSRWHLAGYDLLRRILVTPVGGNEEFRRVAAGCLLADVPHLLEVERFDQFVTVANVRIERIVSTGQSTPTGEWFDQAWDEWVVVITGAAEIL
jgi:hypothetical protein